LESITTGNNSQSNFYEIVSKNKHIFLKVSYFTNFYNNCEYNVNFTFNLDRKIIRNRNSEKGSYVIVTEQSKWVGNYA